MPLLTKLHPPDWWTYSFTHSGTGETETLFFLFLSSAICCSRVPIASGQSIISLANKL